jgi:hypothetical protein
MNNLQRKSASLLAFGYLITGVRTANRRLYFPKAVGDLKADLFGS